MRVPNRVLNDMGEGDDLASLILETAEDVGIDPIDLATVISYETGGSFDPVESGPVTRWGRHRGLIQFGEPQARKYGVDFSAGLRGQLGRGGPIVRYLRDAGVRSGMGLLDLYSAINAGGVGRYNASDEAAGGASGTVRDKVEQQMDAHRDKAVRLLGGQSIGYRSRGSGDRPRGYESARRRESKIYQQQLRDAPVSVNDPEAAKAYFQEHGLPFDPEEGAIDPDTTESVEKEGKADVAKRNNYRQVPQKVLDRVLGKDKVERGERFGFSGREVQKKTVVKEGRKQPGTYRSPRGSGMTSRTAEEQLEAPVGSLPDEPKRSTADRIYNEGLASRENRKGFSKNDPKAVGRLRKATIKGIGDGFHDKPLAEAADMLGIEEQFDEGTTSAYQQLSAKQRKTAWNKAMSGKASLKDAINAAAKGGSGTGDAEENMEEDDDE